MFALLSRSNLPCRPVIARGQISSAFRLYQSNNWESGNRYGTGQQQSRSNDFGRDRDGRAPRWGSQKDELAPIKKSTVPYEYKRLSFQPDHEHVDAKHASTWRQESSITIEGTTTCPPPMLDFEHTPFHPKVVELLAKTYPKPLPIQSQGWPVALSGTDMVGCADTGCGKTLAFVLPALEHIKANRDAQHCTVLVLAPSRELAHQIEGEFQKFARLYGFNTACVYGGQGNRSSQLRQLYRSPQVIVACPGRLLDFCQTGVVNLSQTHFLVLDEADRMLEMGFEDQLRDILALCPPERQLTMWTATWPKPVQSLVRDYFKNGHVRVNLGSQELSANPNVTQHVTVMEPQGRIRMLLTLLEKYQGKVLIFTNSKASAESLEFYLLKEGFHNVTALHGDKTQPQRNAIIEDFKSGILKIVIATDVASRGLDVKDVELVVNFEMPLNIEAYIHRIGRTARAGKKGDAYTFFTPEDSKLAKDLIGIMREANQTPPEELLALVHDKRGKDLKARYSNQQGGGSGRSRSQSSPNPYGRKTGAFDKSGGGGSSGGSWGGDRGSSGGGDRPRSSSVGGGNFDRSKSTYGGGFDKSRSTSAGGASLGRGLFDKKPQTTSGGSKKSGWTDDKEDFFDFPPKKAEGASKKKDDWGW